MGNAFNMSLGSAHYQLNNGGATTLNLGQAQVDCGQLTPSHLSEDCSLSITGPNVGVHYQIIKNLGVDLVAENVSGFKEATSLKIKSLNEFQNV